MNAPIKLLNYSVSPLTMQWALKCQPDLWNKRTARTENPESPHHGLSDIWARFAAPGVDGSQPHESVWYDDVVNFLPVRQLVHPLFSYVKGTQLGGVLLTRIPPGASCKPHSDPGWHARFYDKYAIQIESHPGQEFCFDDAKLVTKPGDCFWFDNSYTHWVTNDTPYERITLIACIRR